MSRGPGSLTTSDLTQPSSMHGLRHTWATLALRAGINPKVVQERLGHSSIVITLSTYSHVSAGLQRDAAEQVAALFGREHSVTNWAFFACV